MTSQEVPVGETRTEGRPARNEITRSEIALALASLLLCLTVGLAVFDEPFHVDELRQVGYYELPFVDVAKGALSQDQPPLDYWIGAAVRSLVGRPSDALERLPAATFSLAAAVGMSLLLWMRHRWLAWVPPCIAALSPLYLSFGAYARPYALPAALMVGFTLSAEWWRRTRHPISLGLSAATAALLPFSRTVEPLLFLLTTGLVLLVIRMRHRSTPWTGPLLLTTGLGIVVAVPMASLLSNATAEFQSQSINGAAVLLDRWADAISVIGSGIPAGLVLLCVALVVAIVASVRMWKLGDDEAWWFIPLLLTPVGSVSLFGLVANPGVPFFTRYAFFFVLPLAVGVALALVRLEASTLPRVVRIGSLGLLVVILFGLGLPKTVHALATKDLPDYRRAAQAISPALAAGTVVLYDDGTSVTDYRNTYFPGSPRYTSGMTVYETSIVARSGHPPLGGPIVVLAGGDALTAAGWIRYSVDHNFSLYTPQPAVAWGHRDLAVDLQALCEAGDIRNFGFLCLVAAQAFAAAGDQRAADSLTESTAERASQAGVAEQLGLPGP
jgi:hypothetical protein